MRNEVEILLRKLNRELTESARSEEGKNLN